MANMIDDERERTSFALDVPKTFNFDFDVVDKWAADPKKLAMLWVDDAGHSARYTFADIRRELSGKSRRIELRQRAIAQKAHGGQQTQAL
jgi:hypothetical protein